MAPKTRSRPKASTAEVAAEAATPTILKAKRSKAAAVDPSPAQTSEEEANDSAQGGASQASYETLQQELMVLRQELADLRQPPGTTLTAPLRQVPHNGAETTPTTSTPVLRGDPNSPLSVGLETTHWPSNFKMPEVTPFEGRTDTSEFLRVYETAVEAAGGDDTTKAKSITLALKAVALTWFFTIPPRSVYAWEQLRDLLRNNFQGNYAEPKDAGHLFAVKQAPTETLRSFFKKFTEVKCQLKGVNETTIINAATCGLQKGPLSERLARKPVRTVTELFDKMEEYARAEEDSVRRGAPTTSTITVTPAKEATNITQPGTSSKPRNNDYR